MTETKKILIAEDDENLGIIISEYLQTKVEGYKTTLCRNGKEAWEKFEENGYDFCIFDVMMPVEDGFTLARRVREKNERIPILFLTAKSMREDRIEGFKIGADDYLTKPFSMEELVYRIKAILKRVEQQNEIQKEITEYEIGNYTFNVTSQKLMHDGEEQKLTSKESELLKILASKQNQVVDRSEALKKIWGDDSYYNSRSMDVYVTKLRKYLKQDSSIEIMNVHGKGFKLVVGV